MFTGLSSRLPVSVVKNTKYVPRLSAATYSGNFQPNFLLATQMGLKFPFTSINTGFVYANAPLGFAQNLFVFAINGAAVSSLSSAGVLSLTSVAASSYLSTVNLYITSNTGSVFIGVSNDVIISRKGAANVRFGAANAAAPVPQTISVQSAVAGTSNAAGGLLTLECSQGTGSGTGGGLAVKVAPAGSSGTGQNALVTAFAVNGDGSTTHSFVSILKNYTVGTLPTASSYTYGRCFVTDALTPVFGSTVAAGGAVVVPVYSDGVNWIVG